MTRIRDIVSVQDYVSSLYHLYDEIAWVEIGYRLTIATDPDDKAFFREAMKCLDLNESAPQEITAQDAANAYHKHYLNPMMEVGQRLGECHLNANEPGYAWWLDVLFHLRCLKR